MYRYHQSIKVYLLQTAIETARALFERMAPEELD